MKREFKVGDKVICSNPTVVCQEYKNVVGVVDSTYMPAVDNGEQVIRIKYPDGHTQGAYVDTDGVIYARQQKTPTEDTAEVTEGYDLSDYLESDQVNSPSHYGQGNIECIDYIEDVLTREEFIGYLRGNLIKYHHRFRYKGKPEQDLGKANWYLEKLRTVIGKE